MSRGGVVLFVLGVSLASATLGATVAVNCYSQRDHGQLDLVTDDVVLALRDVQSVLKSIDEHLQVIEGTIGEAGDEPTLQGRPPKAMTSKAEPPPHGEVGSRLKPLPFKPPAANRARVRELESWSEDEELRERWLFAAEREVLQWFGRPDKVSTVQGNPGERWQYKTGTGNGAVRTLVFNRGRLIGIR